MLERIEDATAHTVALQASGTVVARDVEAAIRAAVGPTNAATGLVVVVGRDFDGYFAELARGLTTAALAHKHLVKLAVVTDPDRMEEARISGFELSPVTIRLFPTAEREAALEWAAAARRGE
ncbi:MAG TPA: STAS/SEC14 domain-containing protein [Roseiarcus sp.]|nr:STAS/SEC14 domain-containing protein [Roseiarcus sp.]